MLASMPAVKSLPFQGRANSIYSYANDVASTACPVHLGLRFSMSGFEDHSIIWSTPLLLWCRNLCFVGLTSFVNIKAGTYSEISSFQSYSIDSCQHCFRNRFSQQFCSQIQHCLRVWEAVPSDAKQSRRQPTGHSDHRPTGDPQQTHCFPTDFRPCKSQIQMKMTKLRKSKGRI